jgi:hypothetical protein
LLFCYSYRTPYSYEMGVHSLNPGFTPEVPAANSNAKCVLPLELILMHL